MILGSVAKSGNPWAKLIALSGPLSCRLRRVISRMTDSVKLCAFSERRAVGSVARICALQSDVGAGAGKTPLRLLEPALPATANVASPAGGGEEIEHVRAAEQPHHLAPLDHRDATNLFADKEPRGLIDSRVLADCDHVLAHDVARDLALLGEDVHLRDNSDH